MTTFTVTTAVNGDTLTPKTGGDVININGGTVTFDQDSYFGVNQNTSASLGNITLSSSLGGSVLFDASNVHLIPYDTGASTVPAAGTTISQGGVTGVLIGVWASVGVAPTTAGSAMPASGFIKIRQKAGGDFAAGALTGISANATGADVPGWIKIVGDDAATLTASRLNSVEVRGDFFTLGTTSGSNTDTFQLPTSGLNIYGAGVFVDKAAAVNIASASWAAGFTVVNTSTPHGLADGDFAVIRGTTPSGYNGEFPILVVDADSFIFVQDVDPGAYTSGGNVVAIEFYPCANGIPAAAAMATDATRGKVCWISAAGVVRFQNDGTNSTGGYLPASGLTVRIPNVIFQSCTTAARNVIVAPNATPTTRYDFTVTGGAPLDLNFCWSVWYHSLTSAYSVNMRNSIIVNRLLAGNIVEPMALYNTHFAHYDIADSAQTGQFSMTNCQQGGTYYNCSWVRSNHVANGYLLNAADSLDHLFYDCLFTALVTRTGTTSGAMIMQRCNDFIFTRPKVGVGLITVTTSSRNRWLNTIFWAEPVGNTLAANGFFLWSYGTSANDNIMDGLEFPVAKNPPYSGIVAVGSGASGNVMKNMGSYASPLELGAAPVENATWSRSGTTVTVTSVAHGLATGDVIMPYLSSDRAPITGANKTITVTGVDTFTFTGVNSGATSGTICYYLVISGYVFQISNATAADGFTLNRVFAVHSRSGLYTTDNTTKNVILKDVFTDFLNTPSMNAQGMQWLNVAATPLVTAVNSIYGTHWWMVHIAEPQATTSATWTRSGTTVTLTCVDHGWRDSRGAVWVDVSSDESALPLGEKTVISNTGLPNPDTILVTGVNAGATSGTATIRVPNARIGLAMNEANTDTLDTYEILAGNPQFTSTGGLAMPTIGDEIIFESPEIKGFSSVLPLAPTIGAATLTHYDIFYSIDPLDGSGYGTEKNLSYHRTGGAINSGNAYCFVTDATGVAIGDYIVGVAIPLGAKVTGVNLGTNQIDIDKTATSTTSGQTYRFSALPNESLDPTGFKIKWRFKTTVTNTTAITSFYIPCQSSASDRQNYYAQDVETKSVTVTNLLTGSVVTVYDSAGSRLLRETVNDGVFVYSYEYSGSDTTDNVITIWQEDSYTIKYEGLTFSDADQSILAQQQEDPAYVAASADISTFDFGNKIHVLDPSVASGGYVEMSLTQLYSNWKDEIALSDNIFYDFAYTVVGGQPTFGSQSISLHFFQQNGWKMRPKEINHTGALTEGVLIAESGGPIVPTVGSYNAFIEYVKPEHAITIALAGALTPTDIADIAEAVHDEVIEGTLTSRQIQRINKAVLAGKVSGAQTGTEVFYADDGTTPRVTSTADENGNRTGVVLNGS